MSRHRFEIIIDVNDKELAAHPGNLYAPPNDPSEWQVCDIIAARERGFLRLQDCEVEDYTRME